MLMRTRGTVGFVEPCLLVVVDRDAINRHDTYLLWIAVLTSAATVQG
jgi:hypothetical protein